MTWLTHKQRPMGYLNRGIPGVCVSECAHVRVRVCVCVPSLHQLHSFVGHFARMIYEHIVGLFRGKWRIESLSFQTYSCALAGTRDKYDAAECITGLVCGKWPITYRALWQKMSYQIDVTTWCLRCSGMNYKALFCGKCTIGWLRLVGSIQLQVSFAEYCLFYRDLLQKRPTIVSILLTEATPYESL